MNIQAKSGDQCGNTVNKNGRNIKCKFHFGLDCFTSISDMKRLVQPDPRDGRTPKAVVVPGELEYNVLRYSLDGSPARGDYPAEDPDRFERDARVYAPTGMQHHGWMPVWRGGDVSWPYWSYQHGFGGDYYGRVVRSAMRFEVRDQIEDVRGSMGAGMQVHHEPPNTFAFLASAWLGINGLMPRYIKLYEPHPSVKAFADPNLSYSWQLFHAENSSLVLLTPEEHRAEHAAKAGAE